MGPWRHSEPAAALGVRIAIDDFGTAIPRWNICSFYRVSRIKIAQQFVTACAILQRGDRASDDRPGREFGIENYRRRRQNRRSNWNFSLAPMPASKVSI